MSYFGKQFVLDSQENFDAFVDSFGASVPEDFKKALINHKGTLKLEKSGDQYTLSMSQPDGSIRAFTFKDGVEFEEDLKHAKAKSTITVSGNTFTQAQKNDNGVTFTFKRDFSDDKVVVTITSTGWSGTAKRVYKSA